MIIRNYFPLEKFGFGKFTRLIKLVVIPKYKEYKKFSGHYFFILHLISINPKHNKDFLEKYTFFRIKFYYWF